MEKIRRFATGSTRDTSNGKLEYSNYIHPLCDYSYAEYMKSKQIIGGEFRRGDNWQKGIPYESLLESLVRHVEVLKLLYKGYNVFEEKTENGVKLHVLHTDEINSNVMEPKTIESELNAIRFNSEAMKLQYITNEIVKE